ncbi:MAG: 4-hydroxy-4-methyl-2-oxoglutarate aldolase [Geminicoccaceae bacterium]|nr:4-hydroxy-4-methyl-2-oxoglutarate aldolase [Geminicoccaceae bacterium]
MIHEPPLLSVRRHFPRPSDAQLAAVAAATTGWLVDAQNGRGSLGPRIKPLFPGDPELGRCSGTVLTCWCGPDDNLALAAAAALARPGDVIVASAEGFEGSGICGDLLAGMMRNKGVAGLVVDGAVRDIAGLREARLPVFARSVNPASCVRSGPGTVGLPVVVGGRTVESGDLLLADEDGVVTVSLREADAVLTRLEEVKAAEAATLAQVKAGLQVPGWVEALLASDRVRWLD